MVHAFSFNEDVTHYFLWDTESGSLHKVDYAAFLCAKERYNLPLSEQENADFLSLSNRAEIAAELKEAEEEGALNSPCAINDFVRNYKHIKALCLHICHDCNMSCGYCFASGGGYNCGKDYMSADTGKAAVDFLVANSGARRNLEIDFFGGEPLLNLSSVKAVVDYARKRGAEADKSFYFTLTTNCLLLNKENADYINRTMDNVVLSIDGRPGVHNAVRHTLAGRDSYERVLSNALAFKEIRKDKSYYARGTFTHNNLDFTDDIMHLIDVGFNKLSVEPVVLPDNNPLAIKKEDLPIIHKEYERLAYLLLKRARQGEEIKFFHFIIDLEKGPCVNKRMTGCGAGCEYLAVSPGGDIYPCHQFVGSKYKMGNVFNGLEHREIAERFARNTLCSKPSCKDCFAKYFCGGGCAANAYNFTFDIAGVYETGCAMLKKRLELALALYALKAEN
jgi:uncharacterized protein